MGVLLALHLALAGALAGEPDAPWLGRPLAAVLEELQERGLKLVYSSRVVEAHMRVAVEPQSRGLPSVLVELLRPHGLEARPTPSGWLVVVRTETPPPTPPGPPPAAPEAGGGEAPEPESEEVLVHDSILVTPGYSIPVQVLDGAGPVPNLGAADFELYVDGRRQEITGLEVVDLGPWRDASAATAAPGIPAAARRHFLLTFDVGSTRAGSVARAQAAALAALRGGFHPTDLVGVATLSANQGPQIALGFTDDRRGAELAIGSLDMKATSDLPATAAPARRPDDFPGMQGLGSVRLGGNAPDLETETREDVLPEGARADRQARAHRLLSLTASLTELARLLGQTPARKHVVLLSEGFDGSLLFGATGGSEWEREQIEAMNRATEAGAFWKVDSERRYGNLWARARVDEMLTEFVRGNCAIEAVDIRSAGPWPQGSAHDRDGLALLAGRTGGGVYVLDGNLEASLAGLLTSTSITYLLSFNPPGLVDDGRFHRLKVQLRKGFRGARVVHQPGFRTSLPYSERSPLERQLFVAGRIAGGSAHNDFDSSVRLGPIEAGVGTLRVPVVVEVDAISLLATHAGGPLATEVHAYAFARDGAVGGFFSRLLRVEPEHLGDLRRRGGLRLESVFELAPGDYSVRALAVNPAVGASSVSTASLRVPAPGD